MSKISFEGIGSVMATCQAEEGVVGGQVVMMTGNGTVAPCVEEAGFCGVAMEPRAGITGVQFKGFMTVPYTGELYAGWTRLKANGIGGVKEAENGMSALVVSVNDDGTAVICL